MATFVDDGNFGTAQTHGPPRLSAPIPGDTTSYILEQDYLVSTDGFTPGIINSAHPTATGFFLMSEGPLQAVGAGVMKYTRTYAKVPASWIDPQTASYPFIGLSINEGTGGIQVRFRQSYTVPCRVRYDYFRIPSTIVTDPLLGGGPYTLNTDGDIPFLIDMQYVYQVAFGGATYGGISLAQDSLNPVGNGPPTWPTSEQYVNTMMQDALNNKWAGTLCVVKYFPTSTLAGGPPPTSGHAAGVIDTANSVIGGILPIEPSRVDRWNGTIFQRAVRMVLAR